MLSFLGVMLNLTPARQSLRQNICPCENPCGLLVTDCRDVMRSIAERSQLCHSDRVTQTNYDI